MSQQKTGCELIAQERERQISEEGWTPDHDDKHGEGAMALAAACYASPVPLLRHAPNQPVNHLVFIEPWPWENKWDKRYGYGERRSNPGNYLPPPDSFNDSERLDLLVKAGALIAAEIDRLLRLRQAAEEDGPTAYPCAGCGNPIPIDDNEALCDSCIPL